MTIRNFGLGLAAALLPASVSRAIELRPTKSVLSAEVFRLDPSGQRLEKVSQRATFYNGQRFRLAVRAARSGYLYVLCLTSQGEAKLLYPTATTT